MNHESRAPVRYRVVCIVLVLALIASLAVIAVLLKNQTHKDELLALASEAAQKTTEQIIELADAIGQIQTEEALAECRKKLAQLEAKARTESSPLSSIPGLKVEQPGLWLRGRAGNLSSGDKAKLYVTAFDSQGNTLTFLSEAGSSGGDGQIPPIQLPAGTHTYILTAKGGAWVWDTNLFRLSESYENLFGAK